MTTVKHITCDACAHDLTHTAHAVDHRLALQLQRIPTRATDRVGFAFNDRVRPPMEEKHFCDMACLERWVAAGDAT